MSALQITMLCVWIVIILGFIHRLGSLFGSGWQAVGGFLGVIAFYGGVLALLYYTGKALFGY